MDLTLPDLTGMVREVNMPGKFDPLGVVIPEEFWRDRPSLPLAVVFGRSPDLGPMMLVVSLNSQPHWVFLREQFPSLTKTVGVGRYVMSSFDLAKMRLLFGGGW
jgi:hypothetical protein